MKAATRTTLLWTIGALCGMAALGLAVLAVVLVRDGANPLEGTGSLGHVGMVVAGLTAALLALFCGGLAVLCVLRVRAADHRNNRRPNDEIRP